MKLSTKELIEKFKKYPLYSQDGKGMDSTVLEDLKLPFGLTIERDLYIGEDAKVKDLI